MLSIEESIAAFRDKCYRRQRHYIHGTPNEVKNGDYTLKELRQQIKRHAENLLRQIARQELKLRTERCFDERTFGA
jgi:hypothetical protein